MNQKKILLFTDSKVSTSLQLHSEYDIQSFAAGEHVHRLSTCQPVYADRYYSVALEGIEPDEYIEIHFFVNDDEAFSFYDANIGRYHFGSGNQRERIFSGKFGYAEFKIAVIFPDGHSETYFSDFVQIMIRRGTESGAVDQMLQYINEHNDDLLLSSELNSKEMGDIRKNRLIDLDTKIALAGDIAQKYKAGYGYFSANKKFKIDTADAVDDISKLESMSPKTLRYISTHTGYLERTGLKGGIKIGKNNYIPKKTLVEKKVYSPDIYENQIVVSFLSKMISDIDKMKADIARLNESRLTEISDSDEYVSSADLFFLKQNQYLRDSIIQLDGLAGELTGLRNMYRRIMPVSEINLQYKPKPTAIFLSIPQYNQIYHLISQWFEYGLYNLDRERFMLSFIDSSSLYEIYVLAKIIDAIEVRGYKLKSRSRYVYDVSGKSKYRNTLCCNTFVFACEHGELTLYYQPVIFDGLTKGVNGIGLMRNTSLRINTYFSSSWRTDRTFENRIFYTPDYLLKFVSHKGEERYSILDAKYSSRDTVIEQKIGPLIFKYLFSISPREQGRINGLYIVFGNSEKTDRMESVYDRIPHIKRASPAVSLIPVSAGINNDMHLNYLIDIIDELTASETTSEIPTI